MSNHETLFNGDIGNEMILKVYEGFRYIGKDRVETLNAQVFDAELIAEGPIASIIFEADRFTLAQAVEAVKARMAPKASSIRIA